MRRGGGRSGESHKSREIDDVGGRGTSVGCDVGMVFRRRIENAPRYRGPLIFEYFVGHALFHVIGFARKDLKRFVLGLPAEASNGAIVAGGIEPSADPERAPLRGGGRQVGLQRSVRRILYQPEAEDWSRDSEDHVAGGKLLSEVRLCQVATRRIPASLDRV